MSTILVVEDDPVIRDVVEHALSQEGMRTVGAGDGEEALGRLRRSEPFDLVVLDLGLPGELGGFSVCREIRAGGAGKESKDVPVVMLTARDDETSVVVGLKVGADDYVSKPFALRELVARVRPPKADRVAAGVLFGEEAGRGARPRPGGEDRGERRRRGENGRGRDLGLLRRAPPVGGTRALSGTVVGGRAGSERLGRRLTSENPL